MTSDSQFIPQRIDLATSVDGTSITFAGSTLAAWLVHRKVFTDATEYTRNADSYADVKTFALAAPVNSMLIGFRIQAELANANAGGGRVTHFQVRLNGTNLGTVYLASKSHEFKSELGDSTEFGGVSAGPADTDPSIPTLAKEGTASAYTEHAISTFAPIKILDASTDIICALRSTHASDGEAKVQNIKIEALYAEYYEED